MKMGLVMLGLAIVSCILGTWIDQFSDKFYATGCIFLIPGLASTVFSYLEGDTRRER